MNTKVLIFSIILIIFLSACQNQPEAEVTQLPDPTHTQVPDTPLSQPTSTSTDVPDKVTLEAIRYRDDGAFHAHMLDIFLPPGWDPNNEYTAIFAIHYGLGNRQTLTKLGFELGKKGFIVVVPDRHHLDDSHYPQMLQDQYCAVAWMFANADGYGINPDQVFVAGWSAGGTLAAFLGTYSDDLSMFLEGCEHPWPDEGVNFAGVLPMITFYDFPYLATREPLNDAESDMQVALTELYSEYFDGTYDEIPGIWEAASPITWIDGDEPPFYLVTGEVDNVGLPEYVDLFGQALTTQGVDVTQMIVPDVGFDGVFSNPDLAQWIEDFVNRVLSSNQ